MATPAIDIISGGSGAAVGTQTFTHTGAASLTNGLILVKVQGYNAGGAAWTMTCTYNGVSMTNIGSINYGTAWADWVITFGIKAQSAGNKQVVITTNGTHDMSWRCESWTNTDQTTGWDGYASSNITINTDPISLTVASRTGDLVTDAFRYGDSTITVSCNQTQLWQDTAVPNSCRSGGSTKAGGTSVTLTWTFSNTPTGRPFQVNGLNIRASSSSTTTQTQTGLSNVASSASQIGVPSSDITTGNWTSSISSSLYATISGLIAGDTQWIYSPNTAGNTSEVKLSSFTTPTTLSGIVVTVRVKGTTDSRTLTVALYQGATLIQSNTFTSLATSFVTMAFLVTSANAATISDWTDLRLRFTAGP